MPTYCKNVIGVEILKRISGHIMGGITLVPVWVEGPETMVSIRITSRLSSRCWPEAKTSSWSVSYLTYTIRYKYLVPGLILLTLLFLLTTT